MDPQSHWLIPCRTCNGKKVLSYEWGPAYDNAIVYATCGHCNGLGFILNPLEMREITKFLIEKTIGVTK